MTDSIVAIATAPGRGSIGIIRVSGSLALPIAQAVAGIQPKPRHAHYGPLRDASGAVLDQGLTLYFPGPHSFTGEDVVEFQGHGGPIVLQLLLRHCLALGARQARAGEFSERAFLNEKLDLAQAEAIADLIDASSEQAARSAVRSLQGEFSQRIDRLNEALIQLRLYVEAAIDFPEEEVDFLGDGQVLGQLQTLLSQLADIRSTARQGALLREGMTVVIAGRPNAGKSSLLNRLSGEDTAIVTDIAGTTRDILRSQILIDGLPIHILDTAGLRSTTDPVEQIGVERALAAIRQADRILLVMDANDPASQDPACLWQNFFPDMPLDDRVTLIRNKIDLTTEVPGQFDSPLGCPLIRLSARQGQGIECLREHLKACIGYTPLEDGFSARERHLQALQAAQQALQTGLEQLSLTGAGELLAEDLRAAQHALETITGTFTADDLLGRIFSSFCIGK